ncbi:MAG: BrnT family toxin [Candidatus Thiosymbion ectosymbiont of Robbea hypermnestra]|nr:BrnT family toxin [Candidatus Thiosymbion ectosymbiont of Robbea hypermnestra]
MRFIWHEPKRQATLKKHGLDFEDAERIFSGPTFTFEDNRQDYGEQRWVTLGLLGEQVVVIVHTETKDEIRVISMREAEKDEQLLFFTNLRQPR